MPNGQKLTDEQEAELLDRLFAVEEPEHIPSLSYDKYVWIGLSILGLCVVWAGYAVFFR